MTTTLPTCPTCKTGRMRQALSDPGCLVCDDVHCHSALIPKAHFEGYDSRAERRDKERDTKSWRDRLPAAAKVLEAAYIPELEQSKALYRIDGHAGAYVIRKGSVSETQESLRERMQPGDVAARDLRAVVGWYVRRYRHVELSGVALERWEAAGKSAD